MSEKAFAKIFFGFLVFLFVELYTIFLISVNGAEIIELNYTPGYTRNKSFYSHQSMKNDDYQHIVKPIYSIKVRTKNGIRLKYRVTSFRWHKLKKGDIYYIIDKQTKQQGGDL